MSPSQDYIEKCRGLADTVAAQVNAIQQAADWFTESILAGRMVHLFGSGHSRIMVEEMWPRYGSFAGFNPIVELSLTFHNQVVGANGQRQAMFLENTHGLAKRIRRHYARSGTDSAIVIAAEARENEFRDILQTGGDGTPKLALRHIMAADPPSREVFKH